jgi:hypothetical protein
MQLMLEKEDLTFEPVNDKIVNIELEEFIGLLEKGEFKDDISKSAVRVMPFLSIRIENSYLTYNLSMKKSAVLMFDITEDFEGDIVQKLFANIKDEMLKRLKLKSTQMIPGSRLLFNGVLCSVTNAGYITLYPLITLLFAPEHRNKISAKGEGVTTEFVSIPDMQENINDYYDTSHFIINHATKYSLG